MGQQQWDVFGPCYSRNLEVSHWHLQKLPVQAGCPGPALPSLELVAITAVQIVANFTIFWLSQEELIELS